MIARVRILLPFMLCLPEDFSVSPTIKTVKQYDVVVFPPFQCSVNYQDVESNPLFLKSEIAKKLEPKEPPDFVEEYLANNKRVYETNVIQFYYKASSFNRSGNFDEHEDRETYFDPPLSIIVSEANEYLYVLRSIIKNPEIKSIDELRSIILVEYFDDEMNKLPKGPNELNGRYKVISLIQFSLITPKVWEEFARRYKDNKSIKPWNALLLDAKSMTADYGPCIVLLQTSIEVMIQTVLDKLSKKENTTEELWNWLNSRKEYWRAPSLSDKCDEMLKILSGKSLKDAPELWEGFTKLKKYRNAFIHSGHISKFDLQLPEIIALTELTKLILIWFEQFLDEDDRAPVVREMTQYSRMGKID